MQRRSGGGRELFKHYLNLKLGEVNFKELTYDLAEVMLSIHSVCRQTSLHHAGVNDSRRNRHRHRPRLRLL